MLLLMPIPLLLMPIQLLLMPIPLLLMPILLPPDADSATPDATTLPIPLLLMLLLLLIPLLLMLLLLLIPLLLTTTTIGFATPHAEIDTDVAEPEQDNNTTSPNTITPPENIIEIKDATYEDMQLIIKNTEKTPK
jgi:hypothetical protein